MWGDGGPEVGGFSHSQGGGGDGELVSLINGAGGGDG